MIKSSLLSLRLRCGRVIMGLLAGAALLILPPLADHMGHVAQARELPRSESPIDFKHILGADYKRHTGEPTGGHSLLYGDVRLIEGSETDPDASGVYRAHVQMLDPQQPGRWITKTDRNGKPQLNTMFPKHWTAEQIVNEVNAAWFSPAKTMRAEKWSALTPSGVRVEGYWTPRVTAYPVYNPRSSR